IAATSSVSLNAGSGISSTHITSPSLILNSGEGDVGTAINPIPIDVAQLTVGSGATRSLFLCDSADVVTLIGNSLAGSLNLTMSATDGSVVIGTSSAQATLTLLTALAITTGTTGSITLGSAQSAINSPQSSLFAGSGGIGSSGLPVTV